MTVLFIDPGTAKSAFSIWDSQSVKSQIIGNEALRNYLVTSEADIYAIEMIASYGMPVGKEVFETCLWIGRFSEVIRKLKGEYPRLVYRSEVKIHHCHSTKANDASIRQALIDRYGAPGVKKSPGLTYGIVKDMWASFAGATLVLDQCLSPAIKPS